jgi:superfamily II DNA or RNA helicase
MLCFRSVSSIDKVLTMLCFVTFTCATAALDMGMGKTLVGCVWGKAFQRTFDCLKIFVICPASLKEEWKRTAENATGLQVEEELSTKRRDIKSLDMKISTWAKVPGEIDSSVGQYVVICDEAHLMQSMAASRTKDVLQLVSDKRYVAMVSI